MNLLNYQQMDELDHKDVIEGFVGTLIGVKAPEEPSEDQKKFGIHPQSLQFEMEDGHRVVARVISSDLHLKHNEKGKTFRFESPADEAGDRLGLTRDDFAEGKWRIQVTKYATITEMSGARSLEHPPPQEPESPSAEDPVPSVADAVSGSLADPLTLHFWRDHLAVLKKYLGDLPEDARAEIKASLVSAILQERDQIPGLGSPESPPEVNEEEIPEPVEPPAKGVKDEEEPLFSKDLNGPESDLVWKQVRLEATTLGYLAGAIQTLLKAEVNSDYSQTKRGMAKQKRGSFVDYLYKSGFTVYEALLALTEDWAVPRFIIQDEFSRLLVANSTPDTEANREQMALMALRNPGPFKESCIHAMKLRNE